MNVNAVLMTQEQFDHFRDELKKEIMEELNVSSQSQGIYSDQWIAIRQSLENKMRSSYNDGCGQWYSNQNGLYAAFRLAFKKSKVANLRHADQNNLAEFYKDLMELIDKYRALLEEDSDDES